MYTDAENRPSNAQTVIGNGATVYSDNVIDLLTPNRNIGRGRNMRAYAVVDTDYVGGTSIQAQLIEHATSTGSSSPTVLATGPAVAVADAVAGAVLMDVLVPDTDKQYLSYRYITVGNVTAGKVSSFILADTDFVSTGIPMNQGLSA
jgi:hypothetical protein